MPPDGRGSGARAANEALLRQGEVLEEKNRQLEELTRHLHLELHNLRHLERFEDPRQTKLFEEELSEEARRAIERSLAGQDKDKPAPPSKRNGRRPLPEHHPRKKILLDIPEEEKLCPHGHPRRPFGEEVTEEFEVIPAKFFVNEITRPKDQDRRLLGSGLPGRRGGAASSPADRTRSPGARPPATSR